MDAFGNVEEDRYELIDNETLRFENRNDFKIIDLTENRLIIETADFLNSTEVIITITFKKK